MSTIASPKAELTTLATFRKNYFLENLAVRSDNSVLVTVLNQNCGIPTNGIGETCSNPAGKHPRTHSGTFRAPAARLPREGRSASQITRARARRGNELRVAHADPADSADSGHALVEADEAAIGTAGLAAIIGAPRIVLRIDVRADPRGGGEKRGYEQERLHWRVPLFELIQAYSAFTGVKFSLPVTDRLHHRRT
jgi:hypothetical protein